MLRNGVIFPFQQSFVDIPKCPRTNQSLWAKVIGSFLKLHQLEPPQIHINLHWLQLAYLVFIAQTARTQFTNKDDKHIALKKKNLLVQILPFLLQYSLSNKPQKPLLTQKSIMRAAKLIKTTKTAIPPKIICFREKAGSFLKLKQEQVKPRHKCLSWRLQGAARC